MSISNGVSRFPKVSLRISFSACVSARLELRVGEFEISHVSVDRQSAPWTVLRYCNIRYQTA